MLAKIHITAAMSFLPTKCTFWSGPLGPNTRLCFNQWLKLAFQWHHTWMWPIEIFLIKFNTAAKFLLAEGVILNIRPFLEHHSPDLFTHLSHFKTRFYTQTHSPSLAFDTQSVFKINSCLAACESPIRLKFWRTLSCVMRQIGKCLSWI